MLNKLKVTMIVGVGLQVIRAFFPDLPMPEDFEGVLNTIVNSLFIVVPVIVGWFAKESEAQIAKLSTKP